jgi:hypothetical protein
MAVNFVVMRSTAYAFETLPCVFFLLRLHSVMPPHVWHGGYQICASLAPEAYGVFCLAGGSAEKMVFGSITPGSDTNDVAMCRKNLFATGRFNHFTVGAELLRLRASADRLAVSERDRIRLIAEALLRHGRLTGEQILELSR